MRPLLHPTLVNGRSGDPALYIETLFEKRAILFDLGDISNLPPRKIQRLEHIFVSHTHIGHFIGFDQAAAGGGRARKDNQALWAAGVHRAYPAQTSWLSLESRRPLRQRSRVSCDRN